MFLYGFPIPRGMSDCEMKGFLSFLILWLISKKKRTGSEIALELEERKGSKPSPGTIYPALKDLKDKGLIAVNESKAYTLTAKGKKELDTALNTFFKTFSDIDDMKSCCGK